MAINFPASPSTNDIHVDGANRWQWNGSSWTRIGGASSDSDVVNSTNDNSTTTLYPVMVSGTGNQTAKIATTATKNISFDASEGDLTVGGNISVGGTITYEDVTNVDSIGVVTARAGVEVTGGDISVGTAGTISSAGNITLDKPGAGIVTATKYYGDGSALTGLTAGVVSDAQENTVAGTNAGDSFSGTSAINNTIYGYDAGTNITSGDKNTLVGHKAGDAITTGSFNEAFGGMALSALQTADSNTAVGYGACGSVTTGSNTGIGFETLNIASTGSNNTGCGFQALRLLGAGSYNVAYGYKSLWACGQSSGGNKNTAVGYRAGDVISSGENNICIGYQADASAGTVSNEITIGDANITKLRIPGIGLTVTSEGLNLAGAAEFTGIVTASSYRGDGSQLTGITGTTINNNANDRIITGSGTANTLEAETSLEWDGTDTLKVVHGSSYPDFKVKSSAGGGTIELFRCGNGPFRIGNTTGSFLSAADDLVIGGGSGSRGLTIYGGASDGGFIAFADGTSDPSYRMGQIIYDHSGNEMLFRTNGNTTRLTIASTGDVKVTSRGSSTSGAPFYVAVTGKSSITYSGGQDDTACLRIVDNGSTNSYYHGIELRTRQGGDVRLYAQDQGNDVSDFVIATDNSALIERFRIKATGHAYFKETVGIRTDDVTRANLANPVGAGHSLVGMYIGDGSLLFNNTLNRTGGYYISTETNALNAGPVTLDANMKIDGAWVIV